MSSVKSIKGRFFCEQNVKVYLSVSCNTTTGGTKNNLIVFEGFFRCRQCKAKTMENNLWNIPQKVSEPAAHKVLNEDISSRADARQYGICYVYFHHYDKSL